MLGPGVQQILRGSTGPMQESLWETCRLFLSAQWAQTFRELGGDPVALDPGMPPCGLASLQEGSQDRH